MTPEERRAKNGAGMMVKCLGCGFNVEADEARVPRPAEPWADDFERAGTCLTCRACEEFPHLRESYRRGYNAGINAVMRKLHGIDGNQMHRNELVISCAPKTRVKP